MTRTSRSLRVFENIVPAKHLRDYTSKLPTRFLNEPKHNHCAMPAPDFPKATSSIRPTCRLMTCARPFLPRRRTAPRRHRGTRGWGQKSMLGGVGAPHPRHQRGDTM